MEEEEMIDYKAPEDVKESITLLYSLRNELPDIVTEPIKDLVYDYRTHMQRWIAGGEEPHWDYYRCEINNICHEAEMPPLCEMN
jgi:hypothetical protein